MPISRDFFARHAVEVAPDLLGCVLEHETAAGLVAVELTEVEAYAGQADPASHAYRGKTARNAVMFGPPGHAYVYFTYGMHFCVNLVCLGEDSASAVLLRAGAVIAGEDLARARRTRTKTADDPAAPGIPGALGPPDVPTVPGVPRVPGVPSAPAGAPDATGQGRLASRDLARGPARLCQALGIDRELDGADVCAAGSPLRVRTGARNPARSGKIVSGPRVGVSRAAEIPWRFWFEGEPTVSVYRRGPGGQGGSGGKVPPRIGGLRGVVPPGQHSYPLTARRWHHAGVDDIIEELSWRELLAVTTDIDELRQALNSGRVTIYCGFDPTASGLHIGNLVQLLTLRRLQLAGHRPIGLVGGATGLIGDPSGKSAERVLNPREVVAQWVERIRGEVSRFLDFDAGESSALIVSNLDWTEPIPVLDFLRDIGKHFSVNRMLDRESVKARLEAGGISYTEFSYQLLQAMDFLELYRRYGCTAQLGGSDQWGNLVAGVDLIRRVEGTSVHALATPLITKPDGTKYGKTEGGAIWLSADLMPPYVFYQFWLNVSDAEVPGLLRVFSFKSREEIEALVRESAERPAARLGQRALAEELTTLVHGADETRRAIAASQALFGRSDLEKVDERTLAAAVEEVPSIRVSARADLRGEGNLTAVGTVFRPDGTEVGASSGSSLPTVADLMAETKIVPSKSAARRAIAEGGAYLNNRKVTSEDAAPSPADLLHGRYLILRVGKRTIGAVEVVSQ